MPRAAVAVTIALGLNIAGCGGGDDFANDPRPPASITLSAAILPARVTVSPARFGAGPVELIASNQTSISQRLTLRSSPIGRPGQALRQTTGPINPGDTATLKADLRAGDYLLTARSPSIDPARITVGPRRPGSRDELLQP